MDHLDGFSGAKGPKLDASRNPLRQLVLLRPSHAGVRVDEVRSGEQLGRGGLHGLPCAGFWLSLKKPQRSSTHKIWFCGSRVDVCGDTEGHLDSIPSKPSFSQQQPTAALKLDICNPLCTANVQFSGLECAARVVIGREEAVNVCGRYRGADWWAEAISPPYAVIRRSLIGRRASGFGGSYGIWTTRESPAGAEGHIG